MSSATSSAPAPSATASPEEAAARRAQWEAEWQERQARLAEGGVVPREDVARMSGMEFFTAISAGQLPRVQFGQLLGFLPMEFSPGRFVFQGTPGIQHYNPIGMVHGGYAATLLDSCMGCAIQTMLPAGKGYTTLEIKVNYLRALTDKTGPVRAEGTVIHVGAQVGTSEGRLTDSAGRLYAFATTTCLIFPLK